jgi:hypothetical protein
MKLPYRCYRVRLYHGEPHTTVWRPMAPIILHGPLGSVRLNAVVDSGADRTMLPRQFADALGITVDNERPGSVQGVGGVPMVVHPGEVELEIVDRQQTYRWRTSIRFAPSNHALLGQLGFLEFFNATFDHHRRVLELKPNEVFPGSS